jgi:hypothetical protein
MDEREREMIKWIYSLLGWLLLWLPQTIFWLMALWARVEGKKSARWGRATWEIDVRFKHEIRTPTRSWRNGRRIKKAATTNEWWKLIINSIKCDGFYLFPAPRIQRRRRRRKRRTSWIIEEMNFLVCRLIFFFYTYIVSTISGHI